MFKITPSAQALLTQTVPKYLTRNSGSRVTTLQVPTGTIAQQWKDVTSEKPKNLFSFKPAFIKKLGIYKVAVLEKEGHYDMGERQQKANDITAIRHCVIRQPYIPELTFIILQGYSDISAKNCVQCSLCVGFYVLPQAIPDAVINCQLTISLECQQQGSILRKDQNKHNNDKAALTQLLDPCLKAKDSWPGAIK